MVQAPIAPNVAYYEEFAREYPLFFHDLHANMRQEGEWLDRVLRGYGVATVLDASCGSGRQAIPLAQHGYDVTAADPSPAMLREARRAATRAAVSIPFYEVPFVDLPWAVANRFDAVIALGNGLCNQERREDIVHSLRAMRSRCAPGGPCLVGIKDFDAIRFERPRFHSHRTENRGGERLIFFEVWEFQDPILICRTHSFRGAGDDWSVHLAETREYMLGAEEIEAAAHDAGFASAVRLDHPSEAVYLLR